MTPGTNVTWVMYCYVFPLPTRPGHGLLQSGLLEFDGDIVSQSTVNEIKITLPFTVEDLYIVFSMVIMSLLGALYLDIVLCFESTRLVLQVQWIEPLKLGEVEAKGN